MKKAIITIIFIFISTLSLKKPALASDNQPIPVIEAPEAKKLEETKPSGDKPAFVPVPIPTPSPKHKDEPQGDNRAWTTSEYKLLIEKAAKNYNVDPQVIYATIMTESGGNKYAFRYEPELKDASLGLGQILVGTARLIGFNGDPKELYKPEVSIELVAKYHRLMLDKYGQLTPLELAKAYNAGSPYKQPVQGHLNRFEKWLKEKS